MRYGRRPPRPRSVPHKRSTRPVRWLEPLEPRLALDASLTFNEIMYHPAVADETTLEWIELYNELAINLDVSGWRLAGGAAATLPAGAVVPARGYLVLASNPAALQAASGYAGAKPFVGALDNAGNSLRLVNLAGRVVDSVAYDDGGAWPVAADGSGVSLAKLAPASASDAGANWAPSAQLGGTPGAVNFPPADVLPNAPAGLVSYYDFNQSGPSVPDLVNQNDGAVFGGAHLAGGAATFNDTPEAAIELGSAANFAASTGVAIEARIRPEWSGTGVDTIFRKGAAANPPALVSYWSFDEAATGTTAALDSVGGNTGTFGSPATRIAGLRGTVGAAFFNGANTAHINVGAGVNNSFSFSTGITIAAVIRPTWSGVANDYDEIFRKEDGNNRLLLSFQNDANNGSAVPPVAAGAVLSFGLNVGGVYSELDMPLDGAAGRPTLAFLKNGQPHHVAATYDSGTGRKSLWIDGTERFFTTLSGAITSGGATAAVIGNITTAGGEAFTGTIDEVALWSTALAANQIAALSGGTAPPAIPAASSTRMELSLQNDGNNAAANPPVADGPVLSFGLNVNGTYSELDMPLDGADGRPTLAALQDGGFHHVVATYDSATGRKAIFIDGTERFATTLSGTISNGSGAPATIGNQAAGGGAAFTGAIDDVAYWNKTLAAADVAAHYAAVQAGHDYFNTPAPPAWPAIAFNEIAAADPLNFAVELVNRGTAPWDVGGLVVHTSAGAGTDRVLPAQVVGPGGFAALTAAQLGFGAADGDKLFLYSPGKAAVLDAVVVTDRLRGRAADGEWRYPSALTFGAGNAFALHDEVVINEIMYHDRPQLAQPAVVQESTVVDLNAPWRFDQSDVDQGTAWRAPGFDDVSWATGSGILHLGDVGPPAANAVAGGLRFAPITGDADAGISAAKTYTHTLDFGGGNAATVNGVAFTKVTTNTPPANVTLTGFFTNSLGNAAHNVTGALADLLTDYISGGASVTVTLSGLSIGQAYETRLYLRQLDTSIARQVTIGFNTDGVAGSENAIALDEDDAALATPGLGTSNRAYALSYTFKAQAASLAITLTAANAGQPCLLYGLTNETTDYLPLGTVFSSGLSATRSVLAGGVADPHYVMTESAQSTPPPPDVPALAIVNHPAWVANDAGSSWIGPVNPGTTNVAAGSYNFRTTFDLTGFDPATAWLTMCMYVDNLVTDVLVNGQSTGLAVSGFQANTGATATISGGFVAGVNTLDFITTNLDGPGPNPGGFKVNLSGAAKPLPAGAALAGGPQTYYFRTTFDFAGNPANSQLLLESILDDGAVVYLNGQEIHRQNLPDGAIGHGTPATATVGTAQLDAPVALPATALVVGTNLLAVELHQVAPPDADAVFGLRLGIRETISPAQEYTESDEEWIELYNRSGQPVDLAGWRLDETVDFDFPAGTTIPAGGYLVVAADAAALAAKYPLIAVVGNFGSQLRNSDGRIVLRDPLGNPADEVHYFDAGRWPELADGGGSSLELVDPDADNSSPDAWAASDESGKAAWHTLSYRALASASFTPTLWNEFVLGLLNSGEVLIDDVSVTDVTAGSGAQLLQNGTFESGSTAWRIIGNHQGTVVVDPANPANHVLRLVASGPTEHMHNHAETTLAGNTPVINGHEYQVSLRARWVAGSPQLNTRLYFNRAQRTLLLDVPDANGTPGAANSRRSANAGPTWSELAHTPAVPQHLQAVTVTARPADPDGVASATLWYSVAGAPWASVPMTPLADGRYQGVLPGQFGGAVVQFYVAATDGLGATSTYPAAGAASRALIQFADGQAATNGLHNVRIVMTAADATALHTNTNVMSNQELGATVVYDESTVYYDVGVRLKSSERGRLDDARVGFHLAFAPDHLFAGVHPVMMVDRSGGWANPGNRQDEMLVNQALQRAGLPAVQFDLVKVIAPRSQNTSTAIFLPRFEDEFLSAQFPGAADGTLFEQELIYYPTTTVDGNPQSLKLPQPDSVVGVDIQDLGPDKEAYRWTYLIKNHRERDDYAGLMALARTLSKDGAELDAASRATMQVDEWLRLFALQSLFGVADIYGGVVADNPHNLMIYVRSDDQSTVALPWDWDFAFYRPTSSPLVGTFNVAKVTNLTANKRTYYGHLRDLIDTGFNAAYLSSWATHFGGLVGQNYAGEINYITQRVNYVNSQLPAQVPFRITTNGGADFSTDQASVSIAGDAWINVREIRIQGRAQPLALTWTDLDSWQASVPLASGANALVFEAYGFAGQLLASDTITITSTAIVPSVAANLRITELMYHPADPPPGGPYVDNDFEYVELKNIGAAALPLAGTTIAGGVSFTFPQLSLPAGGHVLVVKNQAAFESRYGAGHLIAGEFSGSLSNAGEALTLTAPLGEAILDFAYDDAWYPTTDGTGASLVIVDPTGPAANWNLAAGWHASTTLAGSPGATDLLLVSTAADAGAGSLRQALLDAQAAAIPHTLVVTIPGPGPHQIVPASPLPAATQPLSLEVPLGVQLEIGAGGGPSLRDYATLTKTGGGALTLAGLIAPASAAALGVDAGLLAVHSDLGPSVSLIVNAQATLAATQHLASLVVGPGGVAAVAAGGGRVVVTGGLSIAAGGKLDLADNDLIVNSPAGQGPATLSAVTSLVATGAAGLHWNGVGIGSSAAAGDPTFLTALGVMLNDDGLGGTFYPTFSGEPVNIDSVLVKYTYYGDADLSGVVDGNDYPLIDNGFNAMLSGWLNGDFDYSGGVDGNDYPLIDNAFNVQGAPLAAGPGAPLAPVGPVPAGPADRPRTRSASPWGAADSVPPNLAVGDSGANAPPAAAWDWALQTWDDLPWFAGRMGRKRART